MYNDFKEMAYDFNKDYNSPLFYSDEEQQNLAGVECPFCGEPIYFDDWDDEDSNWAACPMRSWRSWCAPDSIENSSSRGIGIAHPSSPAGSRLMIGSHTSRGCPSPARKTTVLTSSD